MSDGLSLECETLGCVKFTQRAFRYPLDWLEQRMTEKWNRRAALTGEPEA